MIVTKSLEHEELIEKIVQDKILKHTISIFKNEYGKNSFVGSGIYAKILNDYYLLTAAHILRIPNNSTSLLLNPKPFFGVTLAGNGRFSNFNDEKDIDVGYIKLTESVVNELNVNYVALEIKNFSNHEMHPGVFNYMVAGFPENKITELNDGRFLVRSLVLNLTSCKRLVYDHYCLDYSKFHILNIRGKVKNSKTQIVSKFDTRRPYGLSGGGLWFYLIEENIETKEVTIDYFLIGIMIEFRTGKYQCLIASRIQNLIEIISRGENIKFGLSPI